MSRIDPVRAFVQVAQLGSFTRAAAALGVPKSTVSRWLMELEEQLAVRLVQRTTRRLSLTESGKLYLARVRPALEELDSAARSVSDLEGSPCGMLRVTAPVDMLVHSLPRVFAAFCKAYPQVRLSVLATNRIVDLVEEGVDVALRPGPLGDSSLVAKKLSPGALRLHASREYLRGAPPLNSPEELSQHNCLLFGQQHRQSWRLRGPSGELEVAVNGSFAATDYGVLAEACAEGLGVAMLPEALDARSGKLVRVLPEWPGPREELHALYPSARHLTARARLFIDFLAERL